VSGFTKFPNAVLLDPTLSVGARLLYGCLRHHARGEDECFPGLERLAGYLGVTTRSVHGYVEELVAAGLVEKRRQGRGRTNRYLLRESRSEADFRSSDVSGATLPIQIGSLAPIQTGSRLPPKEMQFKKTQVKKTREVLISTGAHALAVEVLAVFNELTGKSFTATAYGTKIAQRINEHPELDLDAHRQIIERNLAAPWWDTLCPSVIYGNASQFERAMQCDGKRLTRTRGDRQAAAIAKLQAFIAGDEEAPPEIVGW
jgi:Helix-turn-helix domain